ncbi:hypothetical protein ACQRBO_07750 [Segatella copri]|uniref:hypothetical protein n=1 Tax=Segatella copri TaxID=165179 RepID=UPI003CFD668F
MKNFNFSLDSTSAIHKYDNVGAYNTLRALMNRGENLTTKFFTSKDNKPCAWIESRYVAGFKYELKDSSLHGLINYLQDGILADFDINPTDTEPLEDNSDFQMEIFKMFVNAGKAIQYAPLFRTQPKFLSAMLPLTKGKIIFRVERSDELLDYLREKKQVII